MHAQSDSSLQHLEHQSVDFITAVCCFVLHAESENEVTAMQHLQLAEAASLPTCLDFGHCTWLTKATLQGQENQQGKTKADMLWGKYTLHTSSRVAALLALLPV